MNELEVLRIRDEVLQAMYWMRSEGISETPTAEELGRFLALPADELAPYLARFVADDLLLAAGSTFALSAAGEASGKRTFADEMADLTKPTHGECDENCWCNQSPDAAADCLAHKSHVHAT
ncbi:MAG: hypothetical protein H0V81_03500 [Solirubrobacterales bacterium]|nr:hypothetical protein [Solirubrobacterales bacterium]